MMFRETERQHCSPEIHYEWVLLRKRKEVLVGTIGKVQEQFSLSLLNREGVEELGRECAYESSASPYFSKIGNENGKLSTCVFGMWMKVDTIRISKMMN